MHLKKPEKEKKKDTKLFLLLYLMQIFIGFYIMRFSSLSLILQKTFPNMVSYRGVSKLFKMCPGLAPQSPLVFVYLASAMTSSCTCVIAAHSHCPQRSYIIEASYWLQRGSGCISCHSCSQVTKAWQGGPEWRCWKQRGIKLLNIAYFSFYHNCKSWPHFK